LVVDDEANNPRLDDRWIVKSNYSIKHVLIDWVDVADVRQSFYNVNNLYDLFTNVAGDTILKFLKEIDFIYTNIVTCI